MFISFPANMHICEIVFIKVTKHIQNQMKQDRLTVKWDSGRPIAYRYYMYRSFFIRVECDYLKILYMYMQPCAWAVDKSYKEITICSSANQNILLILSICTCFLMKSFKSVIFLLYPILIDLRNFVLVKVIFNNNLSINNIFENPIVVIKCRSKQSCLPI